ncbi:hypothetical protein DINM_006043 [Dirofilaria immitis]|nr:hypothetical protein [Dirofilaria immitis]
MLMKQSDSCVDYFYDQYKGQEYVKDDAFNTQNITDNFRKSSSDIAQLMNSQIELISQPEKVNEDSAKSSHYNDDLQKSIEVSTIPKTIHLEGNSVNLLTLTTTITPIAIITTKNTSGTANAITTRKYKKYKLNAFVNISSDTLTELPKFLPENFNSTNFANVEKTEKFSNSKQVATDSIFSLKESAYLETPVIRDFSSANDSAKTDPLFTRNYVDKQIDMNTTKFNKNLKKSRLTTISTSNLTTVLSQLQTTTSISTTTSVTTTISTSITIPELTLVSQSHRHLHHYHHHHHHQYENYDHESPIIVTALFDIGRGKWPRYTRTYEQYMNYLKHLLKLENCLVIYTDSRGAEFVRQTRNVHNTQIFEISMHDLPLYRYREEMKDWQFSPKTRYHPEANSADYNIIVNSKPYFLYNATQNVRFRTSDRMFVWIDAGYGHGRKGIIPDHCHWRPRLQRDRMTIIQLTPKHDKVSRYSITDLYRVDWVVLSGGFIAGDSHTINRFYRFYQKLFMELLDSGRIDDDQTILTLMLKHYTTLFNPISSNGDWYALFRLFPCHDRQ